MSFITAVETWFEQHFGWLKDFLKPLADAIIANGGEILVQVAQDAVAAVAKDPSLLNVTNAQKREAAVNIITGDLKTKGITAAESAINVALETALQGLKAMAK